jgi:LPS-assembly protein
MKNSSKIIICLFLLLNSRLYAENIDNLEEKSFFCCSIYDLYKTDSSQKIVEDDQLKNINKDLRNEIKILKVSTTVSDKSSIKDINKENSIPEKNISIKPKKVGVNLQVDSDIDTNLIHIEADESYWHENKQLTILQGDTKIIRGNEIIKGELTNFLQLENRARLSGNVQYNADGIEVKAPYAEYNTRESRTDFISPEYKFSALNISGKARYGIRLKNKNMYLKNSTYTTCDLLNPDWNLISKSTNLDFEKGVGTGKDVFITVRGMPVFYSPYMQFSLDEQRKTGFLVPDFSGSWVKGPDVITPFYWNIAENMDMLIEPSYIQERGSKISSHFRYLNENYEGSFFLSYLDDDSEYKKASKNLRGNSNRYNFYLRHKQTFANNVKIDLLYDKYSDKDFFDDFGSGITRSSTSYKTRHAKLNYSFNGWDIDSKFLGYQVFDKNVNLSSQPYDILPEINVGKRWDKDLINFDLRSSLTQWDHASKVDGTRADIQIGFDKTFNMRGLTIKPRLKVQHTSYDLDNQTDGFTSTPSKTIPIFTLDNQLTLSKQIKNTKIAHQIKPRIFYLYSGEENQDDIPIFDTGLNDFSYAQLFRDNTYSGLDRNNNTNQMTFSLSSSFYDLDEYRNIFTASIGRILYFEDRNISINNDTSYTKSNSKIVGELEYNPSENMSLISTFLYDTNGGNDKTEKNIHTFQYRGKGNNILNASYRYRKNDIEQGDVSFAWAINNHLNILGRWNYDFKNNIYGKDSGDIETLAGLEYESCCWKARLVQRKYKIDAETYEKDIQFQIMLKGFTDVGTPLGDLISDSIKGYMDKDY